VARDAKEYRPIKVPPIKPPEEDGTPLKTDVGVLFVGSRDRKGKRGRKNEVVPKWCWGVKGGTKNNFMVGGGRTGEKQL